MSGFTQATSDAKKCCWSTCLASACQCPVPVRCQSLVLWAQQLCVFARHFSTKKEHSSVMPCLLSASCCAILKLIPFAHTLHAFKPCLRVATICISPNCKHMYVCAITITEICKQWRMLMSTRHNWCAKTSVRYTITSAGTPFSMTDCCLERHPTHSLLNPSNYLMQGIHCECSSYCTQHSTVCANNCTMYAENAYYKALNHVTDRLLAYIHLDSSIGHAIVTFYIIHSAKRT